MAQATLFGSFQLNETGKMKFEAITSNFEHLLAVLETMCPSSREYSLAKTHLEEACFYAKKAMIAADENHVVPAKVRDDGDQVPGA